VSIWWWLVVAQVEVILTLVVVELVVIAHPYQVSHLVVAVLPSQL
jgi:hypothetical protein